MRPIPEALLHGSAATRFPLGEVLATARALDALREADLTLDEVLARHQAGEWGDVSAAQRQVNEEGTAGDGNLVTVVALLDGQQLTIFTRGDRTHTLVHVAPRRS